MLEWLIGQFAKLLGPKAPCEFEPHSFQRKMIQTHMEEIRARLGYSLLSYVLCFSLIFTYLPVIFTYSPFFFLHSRWEDAFWCILVIALLLAYGWTLPLFLLQGYLWMKPALHGGAELAATHTIIGFVLIAHALFWGSAPVLLFRLPSFMLTFQSENLLFTPLLNDFLSIVLDFALSSFFF